MFELLRCGFQFAHRDGMTIDRPRGAGSYVFVLFKSKAHIWLPSGEYMVDKNTFILLQPHTAYRYHDLERPFLNDWFHVNGEDMGGFLQEIGAPLDTPAQADDPLFITRCIMELHRVHRQAGPLSARIIDQDIRSFFMKLVNLSNHHAQPDVMNRFYQRLSHLRNTIYQSPQNHVSVDELAVSVNMSKSYFQHVYKELFGCSVMTDLIRSRIEYAQYLLDHSTMTVSAIAKLCGYEYETHFMRQFKKVVDMTPLQYRSSVRQLPIPADRSLIDPNSL